MKLHALLAEIEKRQRQVSAFADKPRSRDYATALIRLKDLRHNKMKREERAGLYRKPRAA